MPIKEPLVFCFLDPLTQPSASRSTKFRKEVRSHVTAQQHRRRRLGERQGIAASRLKETAELSKSGNNRQKQESDGEVKKEEEAEGGEEEVEEGRKHPFDAHLPLVPFTADLLNPLTNSYQNGSLAFQLAILDDSSNVIARVLEDLGTNALSTLVRYTSFHFKIRLLQDKTADDQSDQLRTIRQTRSFSN